MVSDASSLPAGVVIDGRPLRALRRPQRARLRELTSGEPDSHMLLVLRESPEHAQCFIASHAGEIVGWSLARWFNPLSEPPRNAHISVFVAPDWRRCGLGRALTAAAAEFVVGLGLVPWVSASRDEQLAFYRGCRGVRIARTPFQPR